MKNNAVGFAAFLVMAALLAAPGLAERIERDYHETFEVEPGARLDLRHGDGDVTVTPWDRDVVDVEVRYRAEVKGFGSSRRGDFEVDFDQHGNTIRITGREPSFRGIGYSREHVYTYKIQAPPYVELRLVGDDGDAVIEGWRAVIEATLEDGDLQLRDVEAERFDLRLDDGDLVIHDLAGELVLKTADGDVEVRDCRSARFEASTDDGDITVRRCEGDFEIRAADGDVRLIAVRLGKLYLETDDGDVELDLLEAHGVDLEVSTQDGTIDVTADGLSAELEINTGGGRIRVDSPGADLTRSKRRVSGRLGDGGGRIRITSDDGDVTLRDTSR